MRKLLLVSTMLVAACDLSPEYSLPDMLGGERFKEATQEAPAAPATVATAEPVAPIEDVKWKRVDEKAKISEVAWWRMFNLPELDALEEQAMKDNPSLEVAAARMRAARGVADVADADLYPSVSAGFGPQRQKSPAASINANLPPGTNVTTKPFTTYTAQGTVAYTFDLFGRYRNTARAADHDADAEENNYRAARLTLQAELAQAYVTYAALQGELDVLTRAVETRSITRDRNKNKHDIGSIDDLTYSNSESELANAQADRAAVAQRLALTEHQIAALVGVSPNQLALKKVTLTTPPPTVPAGVPSRLLERRPDVQAAVQQIAAANARVGAARAGYFPDISLSAIGGFTSIELADLFKKSSQFWSLGPLGGGTILTQPIFEGGRLSGTLAARKADYDAASATYKAVVLNSFREVEDNLSSLRTLNEQAAARNEAVRAATRATKVAEERYQIGYSSQLDYLDAERGQLIAERSQTQILGQQYINTIQLVQALGGTWQAEEKPDAATPPAAKPEAPAVEAAPAKAEETAPVDATDTPWWQVW